MFNPKLPITKEFILSRVSEEDIFERYLGFRPDYRNQYCNPLREDNHPSCSFYVNGQERIKFVDHAGGFNWDCFNVVEHLFKVDFRAAMKIIATDFNLTEGVATIPSEMRSKRAKEKIELRIRKRSWFKHDFKFWTDRYYQTEEDLAALYIVPVAEAWFVRDNRLERFYINDPNDPCYAYCFGGYDYKLYFPFRPKGRKFIQNRGDIVQGLHLLPPKGHILINTKSYKDVACIRKFQKEFDIHSIAMMGETIMLPPELYNVLTASFDYVFDLFDFDKAGIRLMRKYEQKYETPWLLFGKQYRVQGIKDFADHLHIKRYDETLKLMKYVYSERIG